MNRTDIKITGIEAYALKSIVGAADLPGQGGSRSLDPSSVLVKIKTNQGIEGVGESFYRSIEDNRFLATSVHSLGRHLIGENPLDVSDQWHRIYMHAKRSGGYGAMSALDEALWDIKGKVANQPVFELLGGHTTPVQAYATYPLGETIQDRIDGANWLSGHGFVLMKIPVGYGVQEDTRLIKEITKNLPKGFGLSIDANTTYDFASALAVARVASDYNVEWFEEPIEHFNVHATAELNRIVTVPISGYQTHNTHYPAAEMLRANALDIYQPSLDYVGGITGAWRTGTLAEAHGKRVVPHTMGPVLNFAASLHVATALRACTLVEFPVLSKEVDNPGQFHGGSYVKNISEFALRKDGTLAPPNNRAGLGVEIDWDIVKELTDVNYSIE